MLMSRLCLSGVRLLIARLGRSGFKHSVSAKVDVYPVSKWQVFTVLTVIHRHCYLALIQPMVDICHCYNLGLLNSQKSKACHRAEMLRLMQGTEVKMIGKAARLSVEAREVHVPHQWERQGVQQHEVCHTVICASTDHINMHKLSDRAR